MLVERFPHTCRPLSHRTDECARTLTQGAVPETECAEARRVYRKLIDLHPRLRLDAPQRASLLAELTLLRTRLDECDRSRG